MSLTQQVLPEHLRPEPASHDRELLESALAVLPAEEHQRILTDLVLTARSCDITRNYSPLRHLTDSLFVTARLHRSPEYREAMERAKAQAKTPGRAVDMGEYLERLRKRTL